MSRLVPIDKVDPSPWAAQSREWIADGFDLDAHLEWLAEDIRDRGIQTPLHVYPREDCYELLHGHNRLEAAKRAGLSEVPIETRGTLTDEDARREYFVKSNGHQHWSKRKVAGAEWLRRPDSTVREIADRAAVSYGTAHAAREKLMEAELINADKLPGADGKARPRQYKPRELDPEPELPNPTEQLRRQREAGAAESAAFPEPEERGEAINRDDPAPARVADTKTESRIATERRPYTARMKALVTAALDARDAGDNEIENIPANEMMLDGVREARDLLTRVIRAHTTEVANGHEN